MAVTALIVLLFVALFEAQFYFLLPIPMPCRSTTYTPWGFIQVKAFGLAKVFDLILIIGDE